MQDFVFGKIFAEFYYISSVSENLINTSSRPIKICVFGT